MGLRTYILKRIFFSFVILYFVITVNFIIFMLMPGDPVSMLASQMKLKEPEMIEAVTKAFGLDQPIHVRYVKYVINMVTGQFGYSYVTRRPIASEIGMRLQNTLVLCIPPEIFSVIIGIVLGVIAANKRGKLIDSASVVTSIIGWSLPVYWMAMQFILIFAYQLGWFPPGHSVPMYWRYLPPQTIWEDWGTRLWHLVLPWTTLFLWSYGGYLLLTRAQMLECITEDYVVTARAKGFKERTVLFKHTLKNALLPIITEAAVYFGFMLGGAIITEQVFKYPGLGWWIWQSIGYRDYPALQAIFFIIAICVIIANFIADLLYGVIDPRVKYG
ncbi:MAG: ABC transporter permease [Desulfobacterales bacterium]|nr:ABC transporter permease [Desulfobacterales bacterium]